MTHYLTNILSPVLPYLEPIQSKVNSACRNLEPWQILLYSSGCTLASVWVYEFIFDSEEDLKTRAKAVLFSIVKKLPAVRKKIAEEFEKTANGLEKSFQKSNKGQLFIQRLPLKGLTEDELDKSLQLYHDLVDVKWQEGACSGTVYSGEEKLTKLITKVYGDFAWTNPLHADVFPDIRKMEAEIVRMTCNMFNGSPASCGTMTTGGSESIMLACKAYRDRAYAMGIRRPEMICPVTAHAAFDKAAGYFRMKMIRMPINEVTRKAEVEAMRKAISKNTCMLVGSAPHFPHGIVDPISEIAKLGEKYGIPVHVDCCLGGFLVPFMKKAGFQVESVDFSLPGVTSISADTHKYGLAPKGSSVIMYSDKKYRKYQYFVTTDWPGGIYASPTFAGSRAGGIIATCWATMMYTGEAGYVEITKRVVGTTRYIAESLRKVPNIFLYGYPEICVVGMGSKDFNIYRLSDAMTLKGWHMGPLQFPSSIHLCVTMVHTKTGVADKFLTDLKDCIREIMKDPKAECGGKGAMYGLAQSIPDRSIVGDIATLFFDAYYNTEAAGTK